MGCQQSCVRSRAELAKGQIRMLTYLGMLRCLWFRTFEPRASLPFLEGISCQTNRPRASACAYLKGPNQNKQTNASKPKQSKSKREV